MNERERIEALEKQVAVARAQGRVDGLREAAGFVMSGWGGEVGEAIASDIDALARTEFEPAGHSSGHDDAEARAQGRNTGLKEALVETHIALTYPSINHGSEWAEGFTTGLNQVCKKVEDLIDTPAPDPVKEAARVLLSCDGEISIMAKAMHDGPLGAGDHEYRPDSEAGAWCIQMTRAALRALADKGDTPAPDPVKEAAQPSDWQTNDACMSYNHSFGLMSISQANQLRAEAREWLRAWQRALADKGDT